MSHPCAFILSRISEVARKGGSVIPPAFGVFSEIAWNSELKSQIK
jgi:hypothetical protein